MLTPWTALLSAPHRDDLVQAPLAKPMNAGATVFGRFGFWFACIALAVSVAAAANDSKRNEANIPSSVETWRVGACVAGSSSVIPVSCSNGHSGKIVSRATNQFACPTRTESFVNDGANVWCIDEDL